MLLNYQLRWVARDGIPHVMKKSVTAIVASLLSDVLRDHRWWPVALAKEASVAKVIGTASVHIFNLLRNP